jgi:hypothetical protein
MLRYDQVKFDYEPYPIGLIENVLEPKMYQGLTGDYPELELFKYMPNLGHKYSLSESNNPNDYHRFLKENEGWGRFHDYIKSREFIEKTIGMLGTNFIDLGMKKYRIVSNKRSNRAYPWNALLRVPELSARFEFSMMNGKGGSIRPHTDMPRKLITIVFSMVKPGEWKDEWGGGTAVVWPKDKRKSYNQINYYLPFEEVDVVKEYGFNPNQALIFVKTFNSWHAVNPMTSKTDNALRKTVTINIERKY